MCLRFDMGKRPTRRHMHARAMVERCTACIDAPSGFAGCSVVKRGRKWRASVRALSVSRAVLGGRESVLSGGAGSLWIGCYLLSLPSVAGRESWRVGGGIDDNRSGWKHGHVRDGRVVSGQAAIQAVSIAPDVRRGANQSAEEE